MLLERIAVKQLQFTASVSALVFALLSHEAAQLLLIERLPLERPSVIELELVVNTVRSPADSVNAGVSL